MTGGSILAAHRRPPDRESIGLVDECPDAFLVSIDSRSSCVPQRSPFPAHQISVKYTVYTPSLSCCSVSASYLGRPFVQSFSEASRSLTRHHGFRSCILLPGIAPRSPPTPTPCQSHNFFRGRPLDLPWSQARPPTSVAISNLLRVSTRSFTCFLYFVPNFSQSHYSAIIPPRACTEFRQPSRSK